MTPTLPAADSGDPESYATAMAMCADRVIHAVHDEDHDRTLAAIREALSLTPPAGVDPAVALATVLAANVSPDRPLTSRLAWVRDIGLEHAA